MIKMSKSVWDKYKTSDESVICMVGVLSLCVCLCKADGDFDENEFTMILSLIPHLDDEQDFLISLIQEIDNNNNSYEFHAKNIKKYLSTQPAFFDFIIATLIKLAWADHVMDDKENEMIINVKKIFEETEV